MARSFKTWRQRKRLPGSGGSVDDSVSRLSKWAITCYALILLSFVQLSARTDLVDRWHEQNWYQEAVTKRLNDVVYLLEAFRIRSPSFSTFSTGNFVALAHDNCTAQALSNPQIDCPPAVDMTWRVGASHATYLASDVGITNETIHFVQRLGPLVHTYAVAPASSRPSLQRQIEALLNDEPLQRNVLRLQDILIFADALRGYSDTADARREVAIWALDGRPPQSLMRSSWTIGGGNYGGPNFREIQSGNNYRRFQKFKDYLHTIIEIHSKDDDFYDLIASVRETWALELFMESKQQGGNERLSLGGVQASLPQLTLLLPLVLVSVFGVIVVSYVNWLSKGEPQAKNEFPVFGYSYLGMPFHGQHSLSGIGWLVHISLPVLVLTACAWFATWPLTHGYGRFFRDELCRVGFHALGGDSASEWIRVDWTCGLNAVPSIFACLIATVLVAYLLRAEKRLLNDRPEHKHTGWLIVASSWTIVLFTILRYATSESTGYNHPDYYLSIYSSINYWAPIIMMIALLLTAGRRGAWIGLLCVLSLWVALSPPFSELLHTNTADLGRGFEFCYGRFC